MNEIDIYNFVKEDLPTWNEVYYDYYKKQNRIYEPDNELMNIHMDKYWGIARRKYLIATVANQFNRDLYVNGQFEKLVKILEVTSINEQRKPIGIIFGCEDQPVLSIDNITGYEEKLSSFNEWRSKYIDGVIEDNHVAKIPIYTLTLPDKKPNPFILPNDHNRRIMVDDITSKMHVYPILFYNSEDKISFEIPDAETGTYYKYNYIIEIMMAKYKEYFENGVGWKDENGELIDKLPNETNCVGSGADPAL